MPSCFVIMGFGEKTDLATGRKLNLDMTYQNIIKPAVTAAGYDCIRADEVQHSGVIDIPMYEMLYTADLVVADLSTANLNAIFELGIRYGLRPRATIIIAEDQFNSPFDVNHVVIRKYRHLGPDIGFKEVMNMRQRIEDLARAAKGNEAVDSPVYAFVKGLQKPLRGGCTDGAVGADAKASPPLPEKDPESYGALLDIAQEAKRNNDWVSARQILRRVYDEQTKPAMGGAARQARPRVVQELALACYKATEKAGGEATLAGYAEAIGLLGSLEPQTTTDPETLGLWSAIHKRRADSPGRAPEERLADLNVAINAAERGFYIRQDYYTGGNLAFLLDLRAAITSGEDQLVDRHLAQRYRRRIVDLTEQQLARIPAKEQSVAINDERYWTKAAHAEALIGLGDGRGEACLAKVLDDAPAAWMKDSTITQIGKLKALHGF